MEGQPIALIEAMVTGNVLLSTNHAGIPEIFSEKNGCFIKKRDPQDIYQKLIKINNNSNYYQEIIKHNHLYAKKKFKKELFLDKILEIITR
jgi:glycosyltransferase involved in cell wall biosynthesis